MRHENITLPWYADVLGRPLDAPGVARLIAELGLVETRYRSLLWLENDHRGVSVGVDRQGCIDTIQHMSSEVEGYGTFDGPLPLGLSFEQTRDDVVRQLGSPDHATGPRNPESGTGHGGILRYQMETCWVAVVF